MGRMLNVVYSLNFSALLFGYKAKGRLPTLYYYFVDFLVGGLKLYGECSVFRNANLS